VSAYCVADWHGGEQVRATFTIRALAEDPCRGRRGKRTPSLACCAEHVGRALGVMFDHAPLRLDEVRVRREVSV